MLYYVAMATSENRLIDREVLIETGSIIGVCTVTLTMAFVGLVGLVSGEASGALTRLPVYVLVSSIAFIVALLVMDHSRYYGQEVLVRALTTGFVGFIVAGLGMEGLIYALSHPERVVVSHLFVYLLSAAIIVSGLGCWCVRNWHEVNDMVGYDGL
jgi:hypothetical protein